MLKINTTKFEILTELYTEEPTYPFRERGISKNLYKIMTDREIILVGNYCVEGEYKGELGAAVFFQRENLKEIIQAIEDWLNPDLKILKNQLEITENGDDIGVSFAYPDRYDVTRWLDLANGREAEIDGSLQRAWGIYTAIETGYKLIEELKKVERTLNQTENQRLIAR